MNRRDFLHVSGLTAGALCLNPSAALSAVTEPASARKPFSFVLLGDVHFARREHYDAASFNAYAQSVCRNTEEAWDALWDEVAGQLREVEPRPSFVLQVGDYVHGDCPTPEKSLQLYHDYVEAMSRHALPVPLFLARGNHELQGQGVRAAYEKHMPGFLRKLAPLTRGTAYYSFDIGPAAHIVVLDVYGAGGGSRLDAEQSAWLDADLTAYRQRSPDGLLLVATHAPHFPVSPRGAVFDKDPAAHADLTARLVKHRVHAILCGHLHVYSTLKFTDPATHHAITQVMTYAITGKDEVPARPFDTPGYTPAIMPDVDYRKPEDLAAMRSIVETLRPNVTGFKTSQVPGYQVVTVDGGGGVRVVSYRGLGRRVYETLSFTGV
jgi:3',5'-cyclic AMP phosphodiesterase CpdA